jgi:hypothetical protein
MINGFCSEQVEENRFDFGNNAFFINLVNELYSAEVFKGVLLSAFTKNEIDNTTNAIADITLYRHAVVAFLT